MAALWTFLTTRNGTAAKLEKYENRFDASSGNIQVRICAVSNYRSAARRCGRQCTLSLAYSANRRLTHYYSCIPKIINLEPHKFSGGLSWAIAIPFCHALWIFSLDDFLWFAFQWITRGCEFPCCIIVLKIEHNILF